MQKASWNFDWQISYFINKFLKRKSNRYALKEGNCYQNASVYIAAANMATAVPQVPPKQDLPPPGGYKKIPFARVPPKSYFTGVFNQR